MLFSFVSHLSERGLWRPVDQSRQELEEQLFLFNREAYNVLDVNYLCLCSKFAITGQYWSIDGDLQSIVSSSREITKNLHKFGWLLAHLILISITS